MYFDEIGIVAAAAAPIAVAVSPKTASVTTGGTVPFTATVTGTTAGQSTAVTWAVQEAGGGAVSSAGVYTAPVTAGTYHVVATSMADTSKKDTTTVTVTAVPGIAVAVSPKTASVTTGGTVTFTATVTGTTAGQSTAVTWSVQEAGGGTVDSSGKYAAPATAGTYHVVATSVADTSKKDTATVTVTAPAGIVVSISPQLAQTAPGGALSFAATVTGTTAGQSTAVTWSVQEAGGGTVDAAGRYTAPATEGSYHVVATSVADTTRNAVASIGVTSSNFIPADRRTTWTPGMMTVGGIPNRTTVCATVQASTYGNGAQDATAGIQAAIAACPAGQVLQLSAGTFTINNDLILLDKGITLRGAGAGVTILKKTNGARARTDPLHPVDPTTYVYDARPIIVVGPQRWPSPDGTTAQNLTVDGAKGAFSVTVANGSGFAAGQFVLLDELSGASWQNTPAGFPSNAKVWAGDRLAWNMHFPYQIYQDDCDGSNLSGPFDLIPINGKPQPMSYFCRTDRPITEIKEVASVSGNTITFNSPLHISYRTNHAAQLTRYTGASVHVKNAGVEAMTVMGGANGNIRFVAAAYSWAKNIESTQWVDEAFAAVNAFRVEIRDSYIHDAAWPEPGGAGYAISFSDGSSEMLIENNISINACKVMVVRSCGAGSVFGYNYTDDSWDYTSPAWVEVGINASHMAGPHHVLFEGNYSFNADSDYTHGNAIYLTFLRNHLSGQRRSFIDLQNPRGIGLAYGSWWDSFIGNVIGRPGQMIGWLYEDPAMSGTIANWTDHVIWKLGYDPERWTMQADPQTLSTVIRDGNWDFLTNSVHWHNTPAGYTIPSSLYLNSKPAFFGANVWPWVEPLTGTTRILPAKARYDAGTPNTVP
jgi:hypothetical protein